MASERTRNAKQLFAGIAPEYDWMGALLSFGQDPRWRRFLASRVNAIPGSWVLDVATGTGLVARELAQRHNVRIVGVDQSGPMVHRGMQAVRAEGLDGRISFVLGQAERLPFPDRYFDCVSVGFGLRNMTRKEAALAEMARVLKPGGRLVVLEFSKVWKPLEPAYDLYSFKVLPWLGERVAGDSEAYRYLAESIRVHPDQAALAAMLEQAGLARVEVFNLFAGVVAVHRGIRI